MTDIYLQKAQSAAKFLRQQADSAAETMGARQADLDALAQVAEVVVDLTIRNAPRSAE